MKHDAQQKELIATVRKLREALGDTQQAFADRLGLAIASVIRYERNRVPRGKALARLENVASANGFEDYSTIFRKALDEEFAVPTPTPSGKAIQFRNDDEAELALALLDVLRQDGYAKEAKAVKKVLAPVIAARQRSAEEDEARDMQRQAIVRLLETGRAAQEVLNLFRITPEALADAFFSRSMKPLDAKAHHKKMMEVVGLLLKDGWSIQRMADEFGHGEATDFINCATDLGDHRAIRVHEDSVREDGDDEER
jgi:transcriptional regulator with XRE-family HTH domain